MTLAASAALLLLAGCSAGGQSPEDIAASASAAARELAGDIKASTAQATLGSVASTIGCLDYTDASEDSPFTREYGTCTLAGGQDAQIYVFGTPQVIDTFWEFSAEFGATPDQCAARDLIVVCPAEASDLAAIRVALGS